MTSGQRSFLIPSLLLASAMAFAACGGGPSGPSDTGVRLQGTVLDAGGAAAYGAGAAGSVVVSVEGTGLSTTVRPDGSFSLEGLPAGSFTLVFSRDGRALGQLTFRSVGASQRITIVVRITASGRVSLVEEKRDGQDTCSRGAGFYCQNQDGKNPNMTREQFEQYAQAAAEMLAAVPALDTPEEVAAAVCNSREQLLRQLATLALNLASGRLTPETAVSGAQFRGESITSVGQALELAIQAASGQLSLSKSERNELKDILEDINEGRSIDSPCQPEDPGDGDSGDDGDAGGACLINGGKVGRNIVIEGQVDSGAWESFMVRVQGNRARGLAEVDGSAASFKCNGPKLTLDQCKAKVVSGAKVNVKGVLESCDANEALVKASGVIVQK